MEHSNQDDGGIPVIVDGDQTRELSPISSESVDQMPLFAPESPEWEPTHEVRIADAHGAVTFFQVMEVPLSSTRPANGARPGDGEPYPLGAEQATDVVNGRSRPSILLTRELYQAARWVPNGPMSVLELPVLSPWCLIEGVLCYGGRPPTSHGPWGSRARIWLRPVDADGSPL